MAAVYQLTDEEGTRLEEIQDSLIELYVEQKEALEKDQKGRARVIEREIKGLRRKMEEIKEWAKG